MKFWVLIVKKFRKTHLPIDLHDISLDRYPLPNNIKISKLPAHKHDEILNNIRKIGACEKKTERDNNMV